MNLELFPRARLAHTGTPLERLARLGNVIGVNLYVKRDDCTGLALGGNKARKLDFLMGEALQLGADTVLTSGAMQSNHVRQTAAAASKLGLRCIVLLEQKFPQFEQPYSDSGNVLLDRLLGAEVRLFPAGTDMLMQLDVAAAAVRAESGHPYVIPVGGSNPVGTLGYVECAYEIAAQARAIDLRIDHLVHATGSAGTQAGLVLGFAMQNLHTRVLGISVGAAREEQEARVHALASATAEQLLRQPHWALQPQAIEVDAEYVGAGYGNPTPAMQDALRLAAQTEGLVLDPVYTGKAMAALIAHARGGRFHPGDNVVFLHTGGAPGLFGYSVALKSLRASSH